MLNDLGNKESKFATTKRYIIDSETKGYYEKDSSIKFIAYWIESSLHDYSDAFILVTGNITANSGAINSNNASVAFENCIPFSTYNASKILIMFLLMKLNILTLQCLSTISMHNTLTIIQILKEVYGSLKKMKESVMLKQVLIILHHLNKKQLL